MSKRGLSKRGLTKRGLSERGLSKSGLSKSGLSKRGLNKRGLSKSGLNKRGLRRREPAQEGRNGKLSLALRVGLPKVDAVAVVFRTDRQIGQARGQARQGRPDKGR
ncbi:MAG: hypothetical protein LBJ64_13585 [Deltaproteobacteria bacterium]|nr:hypothetical protein [Deltaproteobacteria bacterium]